MNNLFATALGLTMTKRDIYNLIAKLEAEITVLVFVVLKLTGYISWQWWTIFTPIYIFCFLTVLASVINTRRKHKEMDK